MKIWIFWGVIAIVAVILYRESIARDLRFARSDFKKWAYQKWKDWGEPLLIAALLALFIRAFIFGPYKIPTGSMKPTFMENDKIFVDKISYRFHEPERGDIIVFKYPVDPKKDFVKRLVALPGETVEIREGIVLINGKPMTEPPFNKNHYYNVADWEYGQAGEITEIPEGQFFVLGDNSAHSSDSRQWGFVPRKDIVGKAVVIWWPPNRIRIAE